MLQNLMENYLKEKTIEVYPVNKDTSLPVSPKNSKWSVSERKLQKVFNFNSLKQKEAFVINLLKYNRESDALIEFRVKKEKVGVLIHAVSPKISEIEFEAKDDIDKIRKDVVYYFASKD